MVDVRAGDEVHELHPLPRGEGWSVGDIDIVRLPDGRWHVKQGEATFLAHGTRIGDVLWMHIDGRVHRLEVIEAGAQSAEEEGSFSAPMPGGVLEVLVAPGDTVTAGQALLVLEAMKMEHRVTAPYDGKVVAVHVGQGDRVQQGESLLEVEANEA
ncbi:MAG TPA: biotin/lipoyl-binding protein [Candidatus Poseidoniales archaeon]|nr:MAG TPA: biotin/lipoyl-binding protein [Candidatus Poseidoniales archaeon]HII18762.1 biotin/lipoyl-binding protein [Candidatus Poseidoniaceae archaeon]